MQAELEHVRDWALRKIAQGEEPPWAQKRYSDLVALLNEIIQSRAATISLEDSLQLQKQQARDHQLAAGIRHIDSARRRLSAMKVQLPM